MTAESPLSALFDPETILPAQFFARPIASAHHPERKLMLAVLQDAVGTLLRHAGSERSGARRLVREVEHWISVRNSDWPFSFENICAALNLDAAALRVRLRHMLRAGMPARPARLMALSLGRRVSGRRHRVTAPRPHHRAATAQSNA